MISLTLLFLINSLRTTPLQESLALDLAASARAAEICDDGNFSHGGWTKSFAGLEYSWIGENLARGFKSDFDAHIGFILSPTHLANIINKKYTDVGFGHACNIVVELFGGKTKQ